MTTLSLKEYNRATKRWRVVQPIARVTHARPHGRPRNVGKRMKWRDLA